MLKPRLSGKRVGRDKKQNHVGSLILVCDIVGFSKLKEDVQETTVRSLHSLLRSCGLLLTRYSCLRSGTGDGWLLAYPSSRTEMTINLLVDCAKKLVRQADKDGISLRVGLHIGGFREISLAGKGKLLVGSGLNECTRIGNVGDGGHIVVSEKLIREMPAAELVAKAQEFHPHPDEDPIEVFVKHDEVQRIRVLSSSTHPDQQLKLPLRVQTVLAVDKLIHRTLEEMERSMLMAWESVDRGENLTVPNAIDPDAVQRLREALAPRISILVQSRLDGHEDELHSTRYRCFHGHPESLRAKGKTPYKLRPKPAGPQAKAFLNNSIEVLTGLADFKENKMEYYGQMHLENVDKEQVDLMSRKARAYLIFSFGLCVETAGDAKMPADSNPLGDGVICIDFGDNLSGYSVNKLREIGVQLQKEYNTLLTCLWKLRCT